MKKTKVSDNRLKREYIWWAVVGMLVQYGVPMAYIIWAYDIFKFEERSLSGWGIILIAIALVLLKNKIQDFVVDYNSHLNETAKRGKWGFIFIIIALFLMLSQYWIQSMLIFFLVLGFSNFASLLLYTPYDRKKKDYIELKELIYKKTQEEKIKGITI